MAIMPFVLKQENWTTWKYFLCAFMDIILIAFGDILLEHVFLKKVYDIHLHVLIHEEYSFLHNLIMVLLFDFAVGFIISIMVYFYLKNDELNTLLYEKDMLNQQLLSIQKAMTDEQDKCLITLSGKTKDTIRLNPNNILFIEASGNYVTIHYLEEGKVSRRTLRTTILQMEDALKAYSSIIRCHRAFIVNIAYIEKINTYPQGYLLMLEPTDKEVPVSRTYKKNFLPSTKN
jgi:DNA-binding LytR/AlgR family response regulator